MINPESFIFYEEFNPLQQSLNRLFNKFQDPDNRRSLFVAAGIPGDFTNGLKLTDAPLFLALNVAASFHEYPVSIKFPDYHPLLLFIIYIKQLGRDQAGLNDDDMRLFDRLEQRAHQNLQALKARASVGLIESPKGQGIGTGVYVGKGFLLTCKHVFSKAQVQQAWIRFGYKQANYGLENIFELELDPSCIFGKLDFALISILGEPTIPPVSLSPEILSSGSDPQIRMIHHPLGQPVMVSDLGSIIEAGEDYLDHNIPTKPVSSGSPLFNLNWQAVALHRGDPGIGRPVADGTTEAVPISAFYNQIASYLT